MALSYKPDNGHLDDETPLPPPPAALSIDNGSINDNDEAASDVVPTTTPWYKQTRVHIAFISIWAMALIVAAATIFRPGGIGNKGSVIQSSQATSINSDSTYYPTFYPTFYPTISPVVPIVEEVTVNSKSQKDPPAVEEEIVIPTPTAKPTFGFTFPDQFNTPTSPPVTTGFPTTYMPTEESTNQQTVTVSTEVTSGATTPCREGEDCID
jgi:hypothetical protein